MMAVSLLVFLSDVVATNVLHSGACDLLLQKGLFKANTVVTILVWSTFYFKLLTVVFHRSMSNHS